MKIKIDDDNNKIVMYDNKKTISFPIKYFTENNKKRLDINNKKMYK
jgi:hypothetical protein